MSGSATYNGTGASTFTVTSNATAASGTNTIMLRDGSGNVGINSIHANRLDLDGAFRDTNGNAGTIGQLLASTGSNSVNWIDGATASVGSATSVSITSENVNATRFITFSEDSSGEDNLRIDTNLTYNPSTNTLTAGTFTGALSGTATNATNINVSDESSDTTCNIVFTTAATGNLPAKTGSNLTFNSSNGTLSATTFSGSGASLSSLNASNLSSGTVNVNRLGSSGTRNSTTFLRGDNSWAVVDTTVSVTQTSYSGTNPITTSGSAITIGTASNAYGRRTFSTSQPSGGNDGDIWYVMSC